MVPDFFHLPWGIEDLWVQISSTPVGCWGCIYYRGSILGHFGHRDDEIRRNVEISIMRICGSRFLTPPWAFEDLWFQISYTPVGCWGCIYYRGSIWGHFGHRDDAIRQNVEISLTRICGSRCLTQDLWVQISYTPVGCWGVYTTEGRFWDIWDIEPARYGDT